MLDELGVAPPGMRRTVSDGIPDLVSAELHPPADRRLTVNKFGTVVCYFRSSESSLGTMDVCLEVAAALREPHTVSSLGDGVWQANLLLSEPLPPDAEVRIRFGEGAWSRKLPLSRA
jgi:hypothetical protein